MDQTAVSASCVKDWRRNLLDVATGEGLIHSDWGMHSEWGKVDV